MVQLAVGLGQMTRRLVSAGSNSLSKIRSADIL